VRDALLAREGVVLPWLPNGGSGEVRCCGGDSMVHDVSVDFFDDLM